VPIVAVNDIKLHFEEYGSGEPVVLITGSGGRGRLWTPHQVPALTGAGYRVITVDNRGVPPTDVCPEGFTVYDMAADVVGLIEILGIGPCRIVGFSLGGIIVQELLVARPGLITQAVLMATRGRIDVLRAAISAAESELLESGVVLPPRYAAVMHAMRYLSPRTHNNEQQITDWLDIFEMSPSDPSIDRAQQDLDVIENRLEKYRKIKSECLVIAFRDDLIVPPHLCREVAENIPDCAYEEVAGCGHYGYLEQPDLVNSLIIDFFRKGRKAGVPPGSVHVVS
jgi:pimeloyl-ACP methyl ester carboxylesterase